VGQHNPKDIKNDPGRKTLVWLVVLDGLMGGEDYLEFIRLVERVADQVQPFVGSSADRNGTPWTGGSGGVKGAEGCTSPNGKK